MRNRLTNHWTTLYGMDYKSNYLSHRAPRNNIYRDTQHDDRIGEKMTITKRRWQCKSNLYIYIVG